MTAWPKSVHSGGELRRLSRRFSTVGVDIAPERLREIADGAPASEGEWVDVSFAMVATNLVCERRRTKRVWARRRMMRWSIVAGAVVLTLNALLCLGLAFFLIALHGSPV